MSGGVKIKTVGEDHAGQRLDRWLARELKGAPKSLIFKIIRTGQVRVDGKRAKAEQKLSAGQDIRIPPVILETSGKKGLSDQERAFIKSLVIYDDGDVLALNKPGNIATQGGTNIKRHIDGLLEGLKNKQGHIPKLVHRLDKETSGVLLLARKASTVTELGHLFKQKKVVKYYTALLAGVPRPMEGCIDAPMQKSGGKDKERIKIDEEGQKAITDYQVVDHAGDRAALVVFKPLTGRTHQIRVHAAQVLGCPVFGDTKYGFNRESFGSDMHAKRFQLHARSLELPHPVTKRNLILKAPLPEDMQAQCKHFGLNVKLVKNAHFPDGN